MTKCDATFYSITPIFCLFLLFCQFGLVMTQTVKLKHVNNPEIILILEKHILTVF